MKWKNVLFAVALTVGFLSVTSPTKAWNCPSGQQRVQAPSGTPTTTPYYDVVEGIAFICEPDTPTTPTTPSLSTQNQSQNQQQNNSQSQNSTTTSNSNATGGNSSSTANGGSSVLKNVGNSALTNSGNSSNKNVNVNTATGGTGGSSSSQLTSTTSSQSSAQNNGNNSNNSSSTYNEVRQNPGAFAPANLNTAPCTKGFSGGGSTPAFAGTLGISTTDKGCDSRQTAVIFHGIGNDYAAAKVLCSTSAAKRAHLTLTDCLNIVVPPLPVQAPVPAAQPVPTVIVVPAPAPVAAIVPPAVIAPKETTSTLQEIGECKLVNSQITNVCKRILDDAILRLNNLPNSTLRVTGPIEATQAVKYLKSRVSPSRVEYIFSDEQNSTIAFEIWSVR